MVAAATIPCLHSQPLMRSTAMMSSATALSNRLLAEAVPLRCTLDEQPSVDVAKGVLMTLRGYGESEAFADLHQASQQHHLPLADLAGAVVALISHPEAPRRGEGRDGSCPPPLGTQHTTLTHDRPGRSAPLLRRTRNPSPGHHRHPRIARPHVLRHGRGTDPARHVGQSRRHPAPHIAPAVLGRNIRRPAPPTSPTPPPAKQANAAELHR